jgi:hypothetical protein
MSGVFQNIDPPTPHRPASVYPPPLSRLWCGERTHSLGGEGVGVNILEDSRHCSESLATIPQFGPIEGNK